MNDAVTDISIGVTIVVTIVILLFIDEGRTLDNVQFNNFLQWYKGWSKDSRPPVVDGSKKVSIEAVIEQIVEDESFKHALSGHELENNRFATRYLRKHKKRIWRLITMLDEKEHVALVVGCKHSIDFFKKPQPSLVRLHQLKWVL